MSLKFYVGVTCLPSREENLKKCLNSFIKQNNKPEKVFVSYCKKYKRFPELSFNTSVLEEFKNNSMFEFIECEEDYGPGTKFVAPFKRFKELEENNLENSYLLVADDDRTYYDYWIQTFNSILKANKNSVVTGHRDIHNNGFSLIYGADGYSIKGTHYEKLVNWFHLNISRPRGNECWHHDDHIVSSFYHYNKIEILDTKKKSCHHSYVDQVSLTTRMKKRNDDRGSRRNGECGYVYSNIRGSIERNELPNPEKYIL